MKIPKLQKNNLQMYLNDRATRISIIGPTIRFDWLIILFFTILLLLLVLFMSWGYYSDMKEKIKTDDFVPRSKTVNEDQLNRVISEIDSKNILIKESPVEANTDSGDLGIEGETLDLIDDNS